jgi:hypothetical protein
LTVVKLENVEDKVFIFGVAVRDEDHHDDGGGGELVALAKRVTMLTLVDRMVTRLGSEMLGAQICEEIVDYLKDSSAIYRQPQSFD